MILETSKKFKPTRHAHYPQSYAKSSSPVVMFQCMYVIDRAMGASVRIARTRSATKTIPRFMIQQSDGLQNCAYMRVCRITLLSPTCSRLSIGKSDVFLA